MFRIRFHGRGGQGMKTASRILGSAFFHAGFEVQDAPRYGAERRGAPIFAYVRAAREPIQERGIIRQADLVVVADDTLVPVPAAGVLAGCDADTVLLINSHESADEWRDRLNLSGPVLILPGREEVVDRAELPYVGAACAGAAARLCGVIEPDHLEQAIEQELGHLGERIVAANLERATQAYELMEDAGRAGARGADAVGRAVADPGLGRAALRAGGSERPGYPCRADQRGRQDRALAHHAAGGGLRSLQPLLVGLQHLLPRRGDPGGRGEISAHRLRPLQGLPDLRRPVPAPCHQCGAGTCGSRGR